MLFHFCYSFSLRSHCLVSCIELLLSPSIMLLVLTSNDLTPTIIMILSIKYSSVDGYNPSPLFLFFFNLHCN